MVNRQEVFRGRRTPSVTVTVTQAIAQLAAFVGIVAGFWHITWVAGVGMLGAGLVAVLVHSAGWWRLEVARRPTSYEVVIPVHGDTTSCAIEGRRGRVEKRPAAPTYR